VQVVLYFGEVLGEKPPVRTDRVSAERNGTSFGNVLFEEGERGCAGFLQRDGRRRDCLEQPATGVHIGDKVVHLRKFGLGGVDDQVRPLGDQLKVVVGEQGRNLNNHVSAWLQSRHLKIHPCEHGLRVDAAVDYVRFVLNLPVLRLDPDLPLPVYARPGDAGIDLLAREDVTLVAAGGRALVPTGVAIALPEGYAGFVQPRSGLAFKHGVTCLNTPGLIDSGYRGELKVCLINHDPTADFMVTRGERIAQLVVQAVEHVNFVEVDDLDESSRGDKGFGSTGR